MIELPAMYFLSERISSTLPPLETLNPTHRVFVLSRLADLRYFFRLQRLDSLTIFLRITKGFTQYTVKDDPLHQTLR